MRVPSTVILLLTVAACGDEQPTEVDGSRIDAAATDAAATDAAATDAAATDAAATDAAATDAAATDAAATDATPTDALTTMRMWSAPELVYETGGAPELAIDGAGNVTAIRGRIGAALITTIVASRHVPGTGWGTPVTLSTEDEMRDSSPAIGADAAGNVVAVWTERDGTQTPLGGPMEDVWFRRFEPETGWSAASRLDTSTSLTAVDPRIAVASSGEAIALWRQRHERGFELWSRRYVPGVGWQASVQLTTAGQSAAYPEIAMDPAGNAVVVWRGDTDVGGVSAIHARRFARDTGWAPAEVLTSLGEVDEPNVAVDANGNAIAVWSLSEENPAGGSMASVWSRRSTSAGWSAAVRMDDPAHVGHVSDAQPRVALDGGGRAIAIWVERMPNAGTSTRYNISMRRGSGGSWSEITPLTTSSARAFEGLRLVMNANGEAVTAWKRVVAEYDGHVVVRSFSPVAGWLDEVRLSQEGTHAAVPSLVIAPSGDAMATWLEIEPDERVWSASFR